MPTPLRLPKSAFSQSNRSRQASTNASQRPPLYRSLHPLSGTGARNPEIESPLDVARTADYLFNVFPQSFQTDDASVLFAGFCQYPIIYHCFHYVYAVHQDAIEKQASRSHGVRALWHHSETIRLLNAMISQLDHENIELALLTIVSLVKSHVEPDQAKKDASSALLFFPHDPFADGLNIYGHTEIVQAHANAIIPLVSRAGGLSNLTFPGLAPALAL